MINIGYIYIFMTIFLTVYGQLVLKWQMSGVVSLPESFSSKVLFLIKLLLTNPFIFSGYMSAFIASLFWMLAMTKFEISFAYPFMSSAFVFVFIFSAIFFNETVSTAKIIGLVLIVLGILISSKG